MAIEAHVIRRNTLIAKDYKSLNNVVQLADVTRPATMRKDVYSIIIDMLDIHLTARTYLRDEVVDKEAYTTSFLSSFMAASFSS